MRAFEEQLTLTKPDFHQFLAAGSDYATTLSTLSRGDLLKRGPIDYLEHVHMQLQRRAARTGSGPFDLRHSQDISALAKAMHG